MNDNEMPDFKSLLGISDEFAEASEHVFSCRCGKCLEWWAKMGFDEESAQETPFTPGELRVMSTYLKSQSKSITSDD